ncbi:MAG: SDR family oxidoreductase [Leptospira sp.]|nr:SDR family oxidoreductase [Leptospira sp.]
MESKKNRTVLITGASTGIGKATALYFQEKGWNVAATMRTPEKNTDLKGLPNLKTYALDVTNRTSIENAVSSILKDFGTIDTIVNNAGYGLTGPFEGASAEQIQKQFDTNVFGLMNVTRAILPYFRKQNFGTIINIASMGGRIVFPYYSLYHGTKWAVEGFSESLRFELEPLGIRVKIIEPGAIKTDFYDRSNDSTIRSSPEEYQSLYRKAEVNIAKAEKSAIPAIKVAKVVFKAATQKNKKLRYAVGPDAKALLFLRNFLPDSWYAGLIRFAIFR